MMFQMTLIRIMFIYSFENIKGGFLRDIPRHRACHRVDLTHRVLLPK